MNTAPQDILKAAVDAETNEFQVKPAADKAAECLGDGCKAIHNAVTGQIQRG